MAFKRDQDAAQDADTANAGDNWMITSFLFPPSLSFFFFPFLSLSFFFLFLSLLPFLPWR